MNRLHPNELRSLQFIVSQMILALASPMLASYVRSRMMGALAGAGRLAPR